MRVWLRHTGTVMLTADLYHYPEERALGRMPAAEKTSATPASRARIEGVVRKGKAALWILHDLPLYGRLRHSPRFYD